MASIQEDDKEESSQAETHEDEDESVKYGTNGIISGSPGVPQVRDYFTMLKEKHRDPVASPQE
jgi:hypothetical protein